MSDEKIKEEFIKYFGIEKWNQEEVLSKLFYEEVFICELMKLESIPIIFDKLEGCEAQFIIMEGYIVLNENLMDKGYDYILEVFLHELRHYYQLNCILDYPDDPKYASWKYDVEVKSITNIVDYYLSSVEIDAFAFAQVMMEYVYELPYKKLPEPIQKIIDDYKRQNNLFDFYK